MRHYTGRALLGATALALEAYTNPSPAGAAFLALYLAWGLFATRPADAPSRRPGSRFSALCGLALWSVAAAGALALLLLQLVLPLLASAGAAGRAGPGSALWWALGLRDLTASGLGQLLMALGPPLLCFLASLSEALGAYAALRRRHRHRADAAPGSDGPGHSQQQLRSHSSAPAATAADEETRGSRSAAGGRRDEYGSASSGGVAAAAAALCVALAALLWPAAFNLPWLLVASLLVAAWAMRLEVPQAARAPLLRLCQLYGGACLVVLYGWQLAAPDAWPLPAARAARALGLYRMDPSAVPMYDFVPQVLHLLALTALYGALGFAAAAAAEARSWRRWQTSDGATGHVPLAQAEAAAIAAPLLPPRPPPPPPPLLSMEPLGPEAPPPAGDRAQLPPAAASSLRVEPEPPSLSADLPHARLPPPQHRARLGSSGSRPPTSPVLPPPPPRLLERASAAASALCRHPGVAAVALAGLSMVEVSVVGGVFLAVGIWTLLAPGRYGRRLLRRASPTLTLMLLLWNAAVYVITCLSTSYPDLLPPVLHSLGLFMYESPPPVVLPLAGQAIAILAMAGLARTSGGCDVSAAAGTAAAAARAATGTQVSRGVGDGGAAADAGMSALGLTLVLALYHILHVLVPLSWILLGSYRLDLLHGGYLLWVLLYTSRTALQLSPDPRVGAVLPDVTDSSYDVTSSAAGVGHGGALPSKPLAAAAPPLPAVPPAHRRLRLFASLHLLALYTAMCGQLPGLSALQRPEWEGLLRLVGLWDPARTRDCLPLFGALVLATAHAVAGKTLVAAAAAAAAAATAADAAGSAGSIRRTGGAPILVQGWLLAAGSWLGRTLTSAGPLLIVVLLYMLVLYGTRVGLAGLGYLALGLPLLLAPPLRGPYVARLKVGHQRSPRQPRLYLSSSGASGLAAAGRWLGPAALAAYGAADLCLSYAAATLALYAPPESGADAGDRYGKPLRLATSAAMAAFSAVAAAVRVPGWWWRLVVLVYGGPAEPPGARLMLALARPAAVLLALQLYRWAFAATAVSSWLRRKGSSLQDGGGSEGLPSSPPPRPMSPPFSPPEAAAATADVASSLPSGAGAAAPIHRRHRDRLAKQESFAWFIKRWLVLHLDLVSAALLFATLMAGSGALAAALLAAGVAAAVLGAWSGGAGGEAARVPNPPRRRIRDGGEADEARATSTTSLGEAAEGSPGGRSALGDTTAVSGFFAASQLALAAWLLALYALQLAPVATWLRRMSSPAGGGAGGAGAGYAPWSPAAVLDWLGLPMCEPSEAAAAATMKHVADGGWSGGLGSAAYAAARSLLGSVLKVAAAAGAGGGGDDGGGEECRPAGGVRRLLVLQLFTLLALALRGKARRWRAKLPAEVVAAAAPGQPCCLLWPPPASRPDAAVLSWLLGPRAPLQRALRRALAPLTALSNQVLSRLGRGAYDVLKALDVPAEKLLLSDGDEAHGSDGRPFQQQSPPALTPMGSSGRRGSRGSGRPAAAAAAGPDPPPPPPLAADTPTGAAAVTHTVATAAEDGGGDRGGEGDHVAAWVLFTRMVVRGCLEAWEAGWSVWGGEAALLALLLAAFTAANVTSLALLAAVGAGMVASPPRAASLRRRAVVPLLGCLLLLSFAAWLGLPRLLLPALGRPPPYPPASQLLHMAPALAAWLGLQGVGPLLPWTLFGALLAVLLQVNSELGSQMPPPSQAVTPRRRQGTSSGSNTGGGSGGGGGGSGGSGLWWYLRRRGSVPAGGVDNDLEAPLLPPPSPPPSLTAAPPPAAAQPAQVEATSAGADAPGSAGNGEGSSVAVRQRPVPMDVLSATPSRRALRPGVAAARRAGGASDGGADGGGGRTLLFSPVESWAQPHWGVLDWARYYLVLHSPDLLLVSLVALVALQRDLLRAGYLACALLLFRRRRELAAPGRAGGGGGGGAAAGVGLSLLGRLVAFNFVVLLLEGVFQAPWDLLLGRSWALPCAPVTAGGGGGAAASVDDATAAAGCTFPRLMGLCQLQPGRGDADADGGGGGVWAPWAAILRSPVVADLAVWALLRLFGRLQRSPLFARVGGLAAAAAARHVAALRRGGRDDREAAARGALAASHARGVRERRIAKLKALLLSPGELAPSRGNAFGPGGIRGDATAAYLRAWRGVGIGGGGGGNGGGGAGGELMAASGGGPTVAGLAAILDADVDLAEVAEVAAAEANGRGGGGGAHVCGDEAAESWQRGRGRRPYAADSGGSGRVRWQGVGSGGAEIGGATRQHPPIQQPLLDEQDEEELAHGGAPFGGASTRSMSYRRTRSYADLDGLDPETAGDDGAGSCGYSSPSPLGASPTGPQRPSPLGGPSFRDAPPATGRSRSGLGASAVHRRHASLDTLDSMLSVQYSAGDARMPPGGAAAGAAAGEIEPAAATAAATAAAAAAAAGKDAPRDHAGRHRRRPPLSWPPLLVRLYGKVVAPLAAAAARRRPDDDSWTCYAAFLLFFLSDLSLLSAALLLSMLLYSLLLRRKPRQYWQGALLYAEGLLILQYSYLVLGKCLCATGGGGGGGGGGAGGAAGSSCMWVFGRRGFLLRVQLLGLHSDPTRCLPLFLVYLATLTHFYSLDITYAAMAPGRPTQPQTQTQTQTQSRTQPRAQSTTAAASADSAAAAPASQPEAGRVATTGGGAGDAVQVTAEREREEGVRRGGAAAWLRRRAAAIAEGCRRLVLHLRDVYGLVSVPHELAPHWVKLRLQLPPHATPHDRRRGVSPLPSHAGATAGGAVGAVGGGGLPPRPPPGGQPAVPAASPAELPAPSGEATGTSAAAEAEPEAGSPIGGTARAGSAQAPLQASALSSALAAAPEPAAPAAPSGPQMLAELQRMLAAVYDYGVRVRQAEEARKEWRRRRAAERELSGDAAEEDAGEGADGDGGDGDADSRAAAAAAARWARHSLPRLRLQHEALAAAGAVQHVLLEVVPSPVVVVATEAPGGGGAGAGGVGGGDGGGGGVSPTPAADVAAMLRFAFDAVRRQRATALSVPPFRWSLGAPPAADDGAAAGGSAAGAAAPALPQQSFSVSGEESGSPASAPAGSRSDADVPTLLTQQGGTSRGGSGSGAEPGVAEGSLRQRRRPAAVAHLPSDAAAAAAAGAGAGAPAHRRRGSVASDASSSMDSRHAPPPPSPPSPPPPPPPPELHVPEPAVLAAAAVTSATVESYSRPPRDYYAATACLDLLSFAYALVFYQLVVYSARSLADITDADRRLPLDYLAALMLLFGFMVSERAVYMLGWPAAKLALHLSSQAVVLGWCMHAYWMSVAGAAGSRGGGGLAGGGGAAGGSGEAAAEPGVAWHLRVFLLLRCLGFCLGALQLREGFPPLSAPGPAGGGRQASFFYRRPDTLHNLAFNVFYSLPFLYEIRALLDWTCVTTSLDWYSWLKLEDIRSSLFVATCRNQQRRNRRTGERVPRYVKFMQGVLALAALLLVLWLPPLFFSSGAPTYQVPALQDVHLNISIAKVVAGADGGMSVQRFPIFTTGDRRRVFQWTTPQPPTPSLPSLLPGTDVAWPAAVQGSGSGDSGGSSASVLPRALAGYAANQAMGVCLGSDSDRLWHISPPARAALLRLLDPKGGGGGGGGGGGQVYGAFNGRQMYGGDGGDAADDAPVVLEVRWSLARSAPLASQRGGPGCSAAAYVPLSKPSRRGLVELLTGRSNRTRLTALNATDPVSHGSAGLFPLFMRLKGDTCSVRLGLEGDAPVATPPGQGGSGAGLGLLTKDRVRQSPRDGSGPYGGTALWRRVALAAWPFRGGGGGAVRGGGGMAAVAASADAAAEADRWGDAMVGCSASLASAGPPGGHGAGGGGGGGGGLEWWVFECGALLPSDGDGDSNADGGGGAMLSSFRRRHALTQAQTATSAATHIAGGAGTPGSIAVAGGPGVAAHRGRSGKHGKGGKGGKGGRGGGDEADRLQGPCAGAPGGAAEGLSGPPLVAVLEPVQSGLLGATLSRFGITGLYVTFVFAIGRFLRLSVSSLRLRIPTEDLPSTRRLVALCQDIAVARAEGELVLEDQLFRALINVYRSPELLFELSRKHKQA